MAQLRNEIKVKVAVELGYSEESAWQAVERCETAGALVNYLYMMENDSELTRPIAPEISSFVKDSTLMEVTKLPSSHSSLMKETAKLHYRRHCVLCSTNVRNIVTLPCSHLLMCNKCYFEDIACPDVECGESCKLAFPVIL